MRRFVVGAFALCLSLIVIGPAGAATTTASGVYAGPTEVSGSCLSGFMFNGTECFFAGTGQMTGTAGDPFVAGYQAHLYWTPAPGCVAVSGEVLFAPGWTDPEVVTPPNGFLRATINSGASTACSASLSVFDTITIHLQGVVDGVGVGPFENATGTLIRDGTLVFPGVDNGTFSVSYTVPDPVPTTGADCQKGHWESYGIFKNQGDCVSFVATHGKNEPGKNIPN